MEFEKFFDGKKYYDPRIMINILEDYAGKNYSDIRNDVLNSNVLVTDKEIVNFLNQQCLWFVDDNLVQGNYFLNLLFSLFGIVGLWYAFKNWVPNNNWISFSLNHLGRYSLIVFATHRPLLNYVYEPLVLNVLPNINYICFTLIGVAFLLLSAFILFKIFGHLSPKLVGI